MKQSEGEKKEFTDEDLYRQQMDLLETFREHGAISEQQYLFSGTELTKKMESDLPVSQWSREEICLVFPIRLYPYNPQWKQWYQDESALLLSALDRKEILRMEQIGSTSIPGMQAKAIVDILIETIDGCDWTQIEGTLQKQGYDPMSKDEKRTSLRKGYTAQGYADRVFHLHLRHYKDHRELYFRDYLLEHPDTAKEYEALKQKLAEKYAHNRDAYTEGKKDFINRITDQAMVQYQGRYE